MRFPAGVLALDVVAVLVFAAVGRSSHAEGVTLTGVLEVSWPFLAGLAVGWAVARGARKSWPVLPKPGILVWAPTLVVGMLLRLVTGAGVALSFVAVAAIVLFAFIVGLRAVAEIVRFASHGLGNWSRQVERESRSRRGR